MLKILLLISAFTWVVRSFTFSVKPTILNAIVAPTSTPHIHTSIAHIDPNTGSVASFLDARSNRTLKGISTYDTKHHEYYYAPADNLYFSYRLDLNQGKFERIKAPLIIYSYSYDNVKDRVIVAGTTSEGTFLYAMTWESPKITFLITLDIGDSSFFRGSVAADQQRFYYITLKLTESSGNVYSDNYISLTDPSDNGTAEIGCVRDGFWPNAYAFDTKWNISYILGHYIQPNGKFNYAIAWSDFETGKCGLNYIDINPTANVTAWAYDLETQIAYASATINQQGVLYHIYVPEAEVINIVNLDPKWLVESLEVGN